MNEQFTNDFKKLLISDFDQPVKNYVKKRPSKEFLPFLKERDPLGRLIKPALEPDGSYSQGSWARQTTKLGNFHKKTPSASSAFTQYTNKSSLTNMLYQNVPTLKSNMGTENDSLVQLTNSLNSINDYTYILRPGSKANTYNCSTAHKKRSLRSSVAAKPEDDQSPSTKKHNIYALDFTNKGFKANLLEHLTIMKSRAFAAHDLKIFKPLPMKENPPLGHYNTDKGLELGRETTPAMSFGVKRDLITNRFFNYQKRAFSTDLVIPTEKREPLQGMNLNKKKLEGELKSNEFTARKHFNDIKGKIVHDRQFGMGACRHQDVHPEELARDIKRIREGVKSKKAYYLIMMEQMAERMNAQLRRDYQEDYGVATKYLS